MCTCMCMCTYMRPSRCRDVGWRWKSTHASRCFWCLLPSWSWSDQKVATVSPVASCPLALFQPPPNARYLCDQCNSAVSPGSALDSVIIMFVYGVQPAMSAIASTLLLFTLLSESSLRNMCKFSCMTTSPWRCVLKYLPTCFHGDWSLFFAHSPKAYGHVAQTLGAIFLLSWVLLNMSFNKICFIIYLDVCPFHPLCCNCTMRTVQDRQGSIRTNVRQIFFYISNLFLAC